jgi:hypothetical protein
MQFLNGFRPGDPRVAEAAPDAVPDSVTLPPRADVLIVGCGPAGLTLAAQLAAFADIHTCIVEQTDGPLLVAGCDGARSAQAWGVMDLLAVTDFPDIRCKVALQSAHADLRMIPREGGYLVRLYVEMDKLGEAVRVASRHIGIDLEVKEVPWWSVYEIGQRICDKYDDVPAQELGTRQPRVFIAGDPCHTHSPKAGQGMNFSMQDGFNLGWMQLGHVGQVDGRWRLYAFAGADDASLRALCDFLDRAADSPLHRHTPAGQDIDAVFDLRAVFQQEHREPAIDTLPALLRSRKGRYGPVDHEKVAHQAPASFFGGFMREAAP